MSKAVHSFLFIALTTAAASTLSVIGGLSIESVSDRLLPLVPLLIATPALNNLVGDYAAIIAAHTGDPSERERSKAELARIIFRILSLNIVAIISLSVIFAVMRDYLFTPTFVVKFVVFVTSAITTVVVFLFGLSAFLDRVLLHRKMNPDDLLIPIVTSVGDLLMLVLVALAVLLIF